LAAVDTWSSTRATWLQLVLLPLLQVRDNKTALANYETQDMGKPIDEAEWDMVSSTELLRCGLSDGDVLC
jgi:acyl-CoA reductase-like NAD-dependent aldehyde dehydrogenase